MKRNYISLVFVATILIGCSHGRHTETDLYFGFNKPGGTVSEAEWKNFMEQYISPMFAHGFTVIPAQGKWRDDSTHQLISEPSMVVIAIHPKDNFLNMRIDSIRENYKRLFQQQAVLSVDKKVKMQY
jgi:hypothetical protein